ncbi:MAG: oligosaccharide flippase family protein [Patescibacteria group bacterium]
MWEKIKAKSYKFLRWSEKYTKTDMVYLARGGFWLSFGQVISSGSTFILAIAFANLLPKEIYGQYKYILSIVAILGIATLGGMDLSIMKAVANGHDGTVRPALKTKVRWALLSGLGSLAVAAYYYLQGNHNLSLGFLIIACFLPFMDPFFIYNAVLQGKKNFRTSSIYNMVGKIISIAIIILVIWLSDNLYLLLLAYFASWTFLRLFYLRQTLKKSIQNSSVDPDAINYGKHLSVINIIGVVATYIDQLLIFHFLGATRLAVYAMAIAAPEQIKGAIKNLGTLAFPKFATNDQNSTKKNIRGKTIKLALAILAITILYIILAPWLFSIFLPRYMESVLYSQIFAISLLTGLTIIPATFLESIGAKKYLYIYSTWSSIIQIIMLIILVPMFGLMGAVIARVLSRFINMLQAFWYMKKA